MDLDPRAANTALTGVAALLLLATCGAGPSSQDLASGKAIYETHCATCHGAQGQGDGRAAFVLYPKPRDFSLGKFKIRSTPVGSLPTDDDLIRTVTRGIPNSSMPGFAFLDESERRAVVAYLKSLSPAFRTGQTQPPLNVGEPPPRTSEAVAAGKAVYERLGCAVCHGPDGKGDGPAAPALRDDWNVPIRPRHFGREFKGGSEARDVYLRISTGLGGTPMGGYESLATEQERWQLAYYVQSLHEKLRRSDDQVAGNEPTDGVILSSRAAQPPGDDPLSAAWGSAPAYRLPLRHLWDRADSAPDLTVRALHDDRTVFLLLEWGDSTQDTRLFKHEDFRDAAAIQFLMGAGNGFIGMGDPQNEVNVWHWKADWQIDIDKGRVRTATVYPAMSNDYYPLERAGLEELAAARAAGNLGALSERSSPVEDGNARGPGTLTAQGPGQQNVTGRGIWQDRRWRVVFSRPLVSADAQDAQLSAQGGIPVGFALWDGAYGDRNGQKAVSDWYRLKLADR